MADIFFLTPPVTFSERYGTLSGAGSSTPALGILMLAAIARRNGHRVAVRDASALNLTLEQVMEELRLIQPDIVGITMTTQGFTASADFARRVKKKWPEVPVIIGGPHVSAAPVETLERIPEFDIAVVGEGEETFVELVAALEQGQPLDAITGICRRIAGGVVMNPRRPFIKDPDVLPFPAWDLLEGFPQRYTPSPFKVRMLPAASLVSSRGCPNRCIFCDRSVFGSGCHAFSAEYVIEMMEQLQERHGIRHICFEDDTFVTFRSRLVTICEHLIRKKSPITWSCLGRVNHVTAENLALMKRAGCWQVSYGVESGSQDILDTIRKNTTLEQISHAVELTRRAGILSKGFFIVGHPCETPETLRKTEEFALKLPLDDISVTMLTPFPGTEIYERAEEFGVFDREWLHLNLLNAVFVPYGLSRSDLETAQKRILRRFYLRPRIVANYLGRLVANPGTIPVIAKGFAAFIRSVC